MDPESTALGSAATKSSGENAGPTTASRATLGPSGSQNAGLEAVFLALHHPRRGYMLPRANIKWWRA